MLDRNIYLWLVLALVCTTWVFHAARGEIGPVMGEEDAVLVLRNGRVLRGQITRQEDMWLVRLNRGEIYVPVEQVEQCCESLHTAYLQRRTAHVGRSEDAHLLLAQWCLRHDLLDEAASELADARAKESQLSGLNRVQRQLAQRLKAKDAESERPSGRMHGEPEMVIRQPGPVIPKAARSAFVRTIEPMLLRYCATAGCHHANSSNSLRLNRLAVVGRGHPRLTQRNLASVLGQIGGPAFHEGPLFSKAKVPHGDSSIAQFPAKSQALNRRQLDLLEHWLVTLEEVGESNGSQSESVNGLELAQTADDHEGLISEDHSIHSDTEGKASNTQDWHASELQRGGRLVKLNKSDPFDPRIFNSHGDIPRPDTRD